MDRQKKVRSKLEHQRILAQAQMHPYCVQLE